MRPFKGTPAENLPRRPDLDLRSTAIAVHELAKPTQSRHASAMWESALVQAAEAVGRLVAAEESRLPMVLS